MSGEFQDKWLGHKEATLDFKQLSEFQTRQICQKMAKFIWTDAKYWLNRFMLFVHMASMGSFNLILFNIQLENPAQSAFC